MSVEKENLNSKKQTSESVVERSKSEVFCILFVRRRKGKTTRSLTTPRPGVLGGGWGLELGDREKLTS